MCINKNIFWLFGSILPIFWLPGNIKNAPTGIATSHWRNKGPSCLRGSGTVIQIGHVETLNSFMTTNKGKTTWLHFFPLLFYCCRSRNPRYEIRNRRWKKSTRGFFSFYVLYSTLLHLPPLRFHCVRGCWGRTQDCCDFGINSQTL